MGHCKKKHCKYKVTIDTKQEKAFPRKPQGVVAFCEQIRAFPVGTRCHGPKKIEGL